MKIGELAAAAGCDVPTVRFYERSGLLSPPSRTPSNYRAYAPAHAERLRFIRRCRSLDMTLEEIRELLALRDEPASDCAGADRVVEDHLEHVKARLAQLRQLARELRALRARCRGGGTAGNCAILGDLASEMPGARRPAGHLRGPHS